MEELVRQRINDVLAYYKTTNNKLSDGNSAIQVKLSRQLSQGAAITCQTMLFILSKFPDVSAEWLLRGEGTMLKSESSEKSVNTYNIKGTDNSVHVRGDNQGDITTNGASSGDSKDAIILQLLEQQKELMKLLAKK